MVKHSQTIRWQKATNFLSVFDHFVGFALKGLKGDSGGWLQEEEEFRTINRIETK